MKDYLVEVFNDEPTGWMRKIQIEKDNKVYRAHFFWDMMDGFDLIWLNETPEWADDLDWHELDERSTTNG